MDRRSKDRLSDIDFRNRWVAEAAYYRAESRHFVAGGEVGDWLSAEVVFEENMNRRHYLHKFDSEMEILHNQLAKMARLILFQLHGVLQALHEKNAEVANIVISESRTIDTCKIDLDKQIVKILGLEQPVANDLCLVLMAQKFGYELSRIGNELVEISQSTLSLIETATQSFAKVIFEDISSLGEQLETLLTNLIGAEKDRKTLNMEDFQQYFRNIQIIQEQSISGLVWDKSRIIGNIDFLKIIKNFEASAEHCLDAAKYLNYRL